MAVEVMLVYGFRINVHDMRVKEEDWNNFTIDTPWGDEPLVNCVYDHKILGFPVTYLSDKNGPIDMSELHKDIEDGMGIDDSLLKTLWYKTMPKKVKMVEPHYYIV